MNPLLAGRRTVVTGGAQGIGRAIAQEFLHHGAAVAIVDLDRSAAESTAAQLTHELSGRCLGLGADVSRQDQASAVIVAAADALGGIDVLVNNAGIHRVRPLLDWTEAEWDQVFAVNVKATLFCAQAAVRLMQPQRSGRVINLSSCSGKKADLNTAAYNAAKSAVIGLTRCMALEWGPHGITANAICPGATDTPMLRRLFAESPGVEQLLLSRTPLGRIADPSDQANAAVFLASDLARHITGEALVVSGGEFMSP